MAKKVTAETGVRVGQLWEFASHDRKDVCLSLVIDVIRGEYAVTRDYWITTSSGYLQHAYDDVDLLTFTDNEFFTLLEDVP